MYTRLLKITNHKSFFLFGPRGTGKTWWLKHHYPDDLYIDLLESDLYAKLLANPKKLESLIPPNYQGWIIIDEIQRVPQLLNEVHRLIEKYHYKFAMTGSSVRNLRKKGVNLLAGRALTYHMHPLTSIELGDDFDIARSLSYGRLPSIPAEKDPKAYLESYIKTYLREEVLQEGLTRNLEAFSRFLEIASFSQGEVLNISEIAREVGSNRKLIESYFQILEDLLLATRISVFSRRAKRKLVAHKKFYFFDVGVFKILHPIGPLDSEQEVQGASLETLIFQEIRALNDYYHLDYTIHYWRTSSGLEVDFILYGPKGLLAFEIKRSKTIKNKDLKPLLQFGKDYPEAQLFLLYGGDKKEYHENIQVIPLKDALKTLKDLLS